MRDLSYHHHTHLRRSQRHSDAPTRPLGGRRSRRGLLTSTRIHVGSLGKRHVSPRQSRGRSGDRGYIPFRCGVVVPHVRAQDTEQDGVKGAREEQGSDAEHAEPGGECEGGAEALG